MSTDRARTTSTEQLSADPAARVAAFYSQHATGLRRSVRRRLRAPQQTIEDVCRTAWTILLRRPDIPLDHHGLAWLSTVALATGYPAARQREQPAGGFLREPGPDELPEPTAPVERLADRVADRLDHDASLQALTARQRRLLVLQAIGLSYREISQVTGDSYRTVDRQLTTARRKLRQASA